MKMLVQKLIRIATPDHLRERSKRRPREGLSRPRAGASTPPARHKKYRCEDHRRDRDFPLPPSGRESRELRCTDFLCLIVSPGLRTGSDPAIGAEPFIASVRQALAAMGKVPVCVRSEVNSVPDRGCTTSAELSVQTGG